MGQKINPIGLRLGIVRNWDANWFDEKNMADKLAEDLHVRSYIRNRKKKAGISINWKKKKIGIRVNILDLGNSTK